MERAAIDSIISSAAARRTLPGNLKLAWQVKPQTIEMTDTVTGRTRKIDLYTSWVSAPWAARQPLPAT